MIEAAKANPTHCQRPVSGVTPTGPLRRVDGHVKLPVGGHETCPWLWLWLWLWGSRSGSSRAQRDRQSMQNLRKRFAWRSKYPLIRAFSAEMEGFGTRPPLGNVPT